jgi:hypothetical protein
MIGEEIGSGHGKRTTRRVLGTEPFRVEASFEDGVKLMGLEGLNIGTYVAAIKPDGSLSGTGEGAFAAAVGELATWKAVGTGTMAADGGVHYRGSLTFTTNGAKLAALNATPVLFDFTVDAQGNTKSRFWSWK